MIDIAAVGLLIWWLNRTTCRASSAVSAHPAGPTMMSNSI